MTIITNSLFRGVTSSNTGLFSWSASGCWSVYLNPAVGRIISRVKLLSTLRHLPLLHSRRGVVAQSFVPAIFYKIWTSGPLLYHPRPSLSSTPTDPVHRPRSPLFYHRSPAYHTMPSSRPYILDRMSFPSGILLLLIRLSRSPGDLQREDQEL